NTCLPLQYYEAFKDPEMQGIMSHNGWFFSAGLRDAHKKKLVSAIPQSSTSVLRKALDRVYYEKRRPVVFATVSPMDRHGNMSLSVSAIYERDLINAGALAVVEVNPNFPRTFGDTIVNISEVAAVVESDRPIPCANLAPYTEVDATIGKLIASLVEDGSTIQLGIGNIPNAVAAELKSKKHLGIHTEMFTETMVDLIECGAVDNSCKGLLNGYSVCSFTMGSQRLYDFIDNNPAVLFKSCTFTNDPYTIGRNNKFVSINATLEVDLTGQCASETIGRDQWSGTGGQSETVQGSQMSKGGKSIIAMHSTYTSKNEHREEVLHSKIVPFLHEGAVVTTSRNDTDYVVTEYGIAWLRGRNVTERAEALIAIAHPAFRDELKKQAMEYGIW
ncbi:acetyl-CoA hydrolase/transferase C-terminal domain-containing protein, partial [Oscillibacter sp.]|uniref:acetyl-CoA hydrolase/transferase family protein n=1 Tax=Oscillibacter sp. TaxID=1945593 RepID=UPI0028AAEF6A